VPRHLISVIKQTHQLPDDYAGGVAHAEKSFRKAQFELEAGRTPVKLETEIRRGP